MIRDVEEENGDSTPVDPGKGPVVRPPGELGV